MVTVEAPLERVLGWPEVILVAVILAVIVIGVVAIVRYR